MKRIFILIIVGCFIYGCSTTYNEENKNLSKIKVKTSVSSKKKSMSKNIIAPPPLVKTKAPENMLGLFTPISVHVKDADLRQLVLAIAHKAQINVVFEGDIGDLKVSVNLDDVPFKVALKAILDSSDLCYKVYPDYIKIAKMETRFFHIDYVMSTRQGTTSTQVSLSSSSTSASSSQTAQIEGNGISTSGASTSGNLEISSNEIVDFWGNFERELKKILEDPMYNILQAEYQRKSLQKDLDLLPYEKEYEKEIEKGQIEILNLQKEILKKQIEEGSLSSSGAINMQGGESTGTSSPTSSTTSQTTSTYSTQNNIMGSYTIDPQTGTVVVTTTPYLMKRVEKFIEKVKKYLLKQVLIDVQILEVKLNKGHEIGIDWSKFPGSIEFYKLPHMREIINSQILSQTSQSSGVSSSSSAQGISSPLSGSPFPNTPGGNLQLGILRALTPSIAFQWNIDSLISFLNTQGTVKAVSRPHLLTLNNQPAIVSIGLNDFYVTYEQSTTSTQGGLATSSVTSKVNPLFIGVSLTLTPEIAADGEVILKIVPAINKKVGVKSVPTGISSAPTQLIPIVETRQTSTVVRVKNGQPVIISGLIQETNSFTEKRVPILGKFPIVGNLFSYSTQQKQRSELVVVVVPYVKDNARISYKNIEFK